MKKVKVTREEWKDIKGYEGLYQVSNLGRIKCLPKDVVSTKYGHVRHYPERIAKTFTRNGYPSVELSKNGESKKFTVHRLVANAFINNHENKSQVNHIDGNKLNNHVKNLEWVTARENINHAYQNNLRGDFHHGIAIEQYSKSGEFIRKYKSINQASKITGIDYSTIKKNCEGIFKQAGGYLWKYSNNRLDVK